MDTTIAGKLTGAPIDSGDALIPSLNSPWINYGGGRSEEHTSELQSLMRISYAVFCLKKKNQIKVIRHNVHHKRVDLRYSRLQTFPQLKIHDETEPTETT